MSSVREKQRSECSGCVPAVRRTAQRRRRKRTVLLDAVALGLLLRHAAERGRERGLDLRGWRRVSRRPRTARALQFAPARPWWRRATPCALPRAHSGSQASSVASPPACSSAHLRLRSGGAVACVRAPQRRRFGNCDELNTAAIRNLCCHAQPHGACPRGGAHTTQAGCIRGGHARLRSNSCWFLRRDWLFLRDMAPAARNRTGRGDAVADGPTPVRFSVTCAPTPDGRQALRLCCVVHAALPVQLQPVLRNAPPQA